MRKVVILIVVISALLLAVSASAVRPNYPVGDGTNCAKPAGAGPPGIPAYYDANTYFPYYTYVNIYVWVGPNSSIQRQDHFSPYQLICEYQSYVGRLAWVSTVG